MPKWTIPEFTTEELRELRLNPYVKSASSKIVRYTVAFKEEFWRRYQEGEKPVDIMIALGFNPEVLGQGRISGITAHIRQDAESGRGFHDIRKPVSKKTKIQEESNGKFLVNQLNKLQHEFEYMKQEMEFIKKTILLDREAQQKK